MARRERVTETGQQNRCSVGWMVVAEVDEKNTGSTLCLSSSGHFMAFWGFKES